MFMSKFRFYSIGLVAVDKLKDSFDAKVIPIEVLPDITGEIGDMLETIEMTGSRADETEYTIKLKASTTITMSWLPLGNGNQLTPPDLVKGEKVMIFQFGDTDRYYWTVLGNTHALRLTETTMFGWAARPDDGTPLDPAANMYTLEVSTDSKKVIFKTTQALEEPFAYEFSLDTEVGLFHITDDTGTAISMDSAERIITITNSDGTYITIDKEEILTYCKTKATHKNDGDVLETVKKTVDMTVGGSYTCRAPEMQFGEDAAVQPSTLGDNMAAAMTLLIAQINASQVIGNLGAPTSAIQAVLPIDVPNLIAGGNTYSTVNKNQ